MPKGKNDDATHNTSAVVTQASTTALRPPPPQIPVVGRRPSPCTLTSFVNTPIRQRVHVEQTEGNGIVMRTSLQAAFDTGGHICQVFRSRLPSCIKFSGNKKKGWRRIHHTPRHPTQPHSQSPCPYTRSQPTVPLPSTQVLHQAEAPSTANAKLNGVGPKPPGSSKADVRATVVLSDMAPSFTGDRDTDQGRVAGLLLDAFGACLGDRSRCIM